MYKFLNNSIKILLTNLLLFQSYSPLLFAETDPNTNLRENWYFNETDTSTSGTPSNLKFYKTFNSMPEEINLKLFDHKDLSHLQGKRLFVGYGIVNPQNGDCKVFKKEDTGYKNDITVCLPWWRIEREYKVIKTSNTNSQDEIINEIVNNTKPPILFNYCKEYSDGKLYPGGKVTCTSYYDRMAGEDCWDNPEQTSCWVDNCGENVKKYCTYIGNAVGDVTALPTAVNNGVGVPERKDTKINLISHQYDCPPGPLVEKVKCINEETSIIYPQKCADGTYEYCDERRPKFNETGNISSYLGTCSDGTEIECEVDKYNNDVKICKEPIYETIHNTSLQSSTLTREYKTFEVDVLSGEEDLYMAKENCLRANTVEDARDQELYVKINGSGYLDDDIYVLRHLNDGTHVKVYCNMQHNEDHGNKKFYNGEVLQCIDNDGSYSFNKTVQINTTDIVTVQQNSENENQTGEPFSIGRNHYGSTKVKIDDIEVAPETFSRNYSHYPHDGQNLKTWDNTTSTLSILFPFAGAYDLRFYNKSNKEVSSAYLGIDDFKEIMQDGSLQLKLGRKMELAPGMKDDEETIFFANREDDFVEWGGGVYGGKDSKKGNVVSLPNDSYVKDNAVYSIIIQDLLTGAVTPIPLVYPLPFPNRVFISRLKVYEKRKYRCYNEFPTPSFLLSGSGDMKKVCTTDPNFIKFENGENVDTTEIIKWDNTQLCEQNCREHYSCTQKTINNDTGYSCIQRGGENLGGDLSGNLFSNKEQCNVKCYKQSSCIDFKDNKCLKVEEKLSEPISDYMGKTIYRTKEVAYKCDDTVQKQVGCAKWEITNINGDTSFATGDIGYETFDFSANFEKAVTHAANLEVGILHIWSGWKGECVYGKKWDSSYLSDPMTIVSYASMAYSSYTSINGSSLYDQAANSQVGQNIKEGFDKLSSYADKAVDSVGDAYNNLVDQAGELLSSSSEVANPSNYNAAAIAGQTEAANAVGNAVDLTTKTDAAISSGFLDSITDYTIDGLDNLTNGAATKAMKWWDDYLIGAKGDLISITNGSLVSFGVRSAMILAAPPEESYTLARKLMKGFYGASYEDEDIIAYNSCMASIGLSLPNLLAWSMGDENNITSLNEPWKHPIRVTTSQVATMASLAGEEYVQSRYLMSSTEDDFLISLVALTSDAYVKAGEMLCAGTNVSKAMTHINSENSKSPSGSNGDIAKQIAMAAVGMICAPCGFALTILSDFYTNMWAKIDTCKNEEDALQRDMLEFKTLKFNKQEQCKYVDTFCDKEISFFGSKKCIRERDEFCCYDMVLTRIFAEGMKEQLGKPWQEGDNVICNDLTLNDLKDVSFNECLEGQDPQKDKCMPISKYSEFQQTLFRQATKKLDDDVSVNLAEQVKNAMALPQE